MRSYVLLIICAVGFIGCSIDDGGDLFFQEVMHIDSVEMPSEFTYGETYEISVRYTRPNGCYEFNNFAIQPNGNTRTVFIIDNVYTEINCTQATEEVSVSFNFSVSNTETYIFQFFQGNVDGEDRYLIMEVPVVE